MICNGNFLTGGQITAALLLILFGIQAVPPSHAQQRSTANETAKQETSSGQADLPDAPDASLPSSASRFAPLTPRQKFGFATENAFGPLSLVFAAAGAGVIQAQNLYHEFHQGATGYSRYLWHSYCDQAADSYFAGYILPTLLHQDPRYHPLNKGSFGKRTGYAFSRLLITRSDSGAREFNISQILGSGMAASASSLYYPERDRTAWLVTQRWVSNLGGDGLLLSLREFTPEITRVFHLHHTQPDVEKEEPRK